MPRFEDYEGREQTYVKHVVLERYLQQLAHKVGQFRRDLTLNYVDGFSGPWESKTTDLSDTSPGLAVQQLDAVRAALAARNIPLHIRCLFVEERRGAAEELAPLRARFPNVTIDTRTGQFESLIREATMFARTGRDPFAFVFIDPTGWTGYGLDAITPLLRLKGEVLVNFMTKDVIRFIELRDPALMPSFVNLFGDAGYCDQWAGLEGSAREARIVETYCQRLRTAGNFTYCASSVVLNPRSDRTHFHLIYGTRSLHGLVAFRKAERAAHQAQAEGRATARQRGRVTRSNQPELFAPLDMSGSDRYLESLREANERSARARVMLRLGAGGAVPYDTLVAIALESPMVHQLTLNDWLRDWAARGDVHIAGLQGNSRTPDIGRDQTVEQGRALR